jgi:hypothetical protein
MSFILNRYCFNLSRDWAALNNTMKMTDGVLIVKILKVDVEHKKCKVPLYGSDSGSL